MKNVKEKIKTLVNIVYQSISEFFERNVPLLAAGISFYALFSVAPLGIFAISVAKLFFDDQSARELILSYVTKYSGSDVADVVQQAITATESSHGGVMATVIGVGVVLIGGHSIFVQLRRAMNAIIGLPEKEGSGFSTTLWSAVVERAFSFLAMFILGSALVLFTMMTLFVGLSVEYLDEHVNIPSWLNLIPVIDVVLSFFGVSFIIAAIYRVLPAQRFQWREVLPGSILVASFFFILKVLVGYYLSSGSMESTYGTAGSLIALMVWVYFSSMLLLFGAELNEQISHYRRSKTGDEVYPSIFNRDKKAKVSLSEKDSLSSP